MDGRDEARPDHDSSHPFRSEPAATRPRPPRHVYLIDGSGFIFRAFHKLPPLTRPDGTPVNAVLGFTNMLLKLMHDTDADHLAVIFDAAQRTFRNDLYGDYKAHRPDPPDELLPQFPLIREAVRAFNVACIESEGWEADDLIATYTRLAREAGAEVTIVSSDKDLMQLIRPGVEMFDPVNSKVIGPDQVKEKFCVGPEKVIEVQALAGDSIDNVPGVPGIGVKTAAQLIEEFGDLDTLLARAHEIRQPKRREALLAHAEAARISRDLVRLCEEVPPPVPLGDLAKRAPDRQRLLAFLQENAFRSVIARLQTRGDLDQAAAVPAAAPARPTAVEAAYALVQEEADLLRWIAAATDGRFRRHRYRDHLARCRPRRHRRHLAGDRARQGLLRPDRALRRGRSRPAAAANRLRPGSGAAQAAAGRRSRS